MVVLRHVSGLANLILFVFLLTFLVSIFAVQMFRNQIPAEDQNGNTIEITFSTIYNSFLGMYQILSTENWTTILYNATSYEYMYKTAWMAAAFFILWFILANCMSRHSPFLIMANACSHCIEHVHCCHSREL